MNAPPQLWPHQLASISAVELALAAGVPAGLVVLPTGTGKTGMVLALGRRLGQPMLFLVNRAELVDQTVRAAARFWPEAHTTVIDAETGCWDEPDLETRRRPDLVVGMVLSVRTRLGGIDPERFATVVADEAHLSVAPTWSDVLDHFRPGFLLGVTATPRRLDGKGLAGRYGKEPLYSYSLHQAIKDKRLVDVDSRNAVTSVDLDGVGEDDGESGTGEKDLNKKQLAGAVNNHARNDLVVANYLTHGRPRRAVAFCVGVDHARDLAKAFQAHGVRCEAVTGRMKPPERRSVLADFAAGKYDVLTNCEVLTTGFDDPGISCLLMARPTESRSLYVQMVGRGLRLHPGKSTCLVIDFTDNCRKHKLVSVLDLLGKSKPLQNGASAPGKPIEEKPRQQELPLLPLVSWSLEAVCPWPELPTLDGYCPLQNWHNEPASEGQLRCLAGFGLAAGEGLSKGEASYLIDRAMEYDATFPLPATCKQRRFLEERDLWEEGMGKRQASTLIGLLKGGKKPLTGQPA